MRKIDLSAITTTIGLPAKAGVWRHLQLASQDTLAALASSMINGSTSPYILYGCINTGTGSTYTISAGAIYLGGEIYLVDAASFTVTGSNIAVGTITVTSYTGSDADPITFTDGTPRSVLNIRKIVFAGNLSGSGAVDYSALSYLNTYNSYLPAFTSSNQAVTAQTLFYYIGFGQVTITYSLTYTVSGPHPLLITFPPPIAVNANYNGVATLLGSSAVIESSSSNLSAKAVINNSNQVQLSTVGNTVAGTITGTITYPI